MASTQWDTYEENGSSILQAQRDSGNKIYVKDVKVM